MFFSNNILIFCRVVIFLVFLSSAIGKTKKFTLFEKTIVDFQILPNNFIRILALFLLGNEYIIAYLITKEGVWLSWGFVLSASTLLLFVFALASVLIRKKTVSCNCFGVESKQVSSIDLIRNFGFILCSLGGLYASSSSSFINRDFLILEACIISVVAISFTIIWLNLAEIINIFNQGNLIKEKI